MHPKQIKLARDYLQAIGIDLDDYDLDITVNLSETVMLKFNHKTKKRSIIVEDPTNYPNTFKVEVEVG